MTRTSSSLSLIAALTLALAPLAHAPLAHAQARAQIRAGLPVSALTSGDRRVELIEVPDVQGGFVRVTLADASGPRWLIRVRVTDSAADASALLREQAPMLASSDVTPLVGDARVGDLAFASGAGLIAFARENVVVIVQAIDLQASAHAVARELDRAIVAAPRDAPSVRLPTLDSQLAVGEGARIETPVGCVALHVSPLRALSARRVAGAWWVTRTATDEPAARIIAVDALLRVIEQ